MSEPVDIFKSLTPKERAQSKLHDPTPQRKKYVTDLLFQFLTDQISYAQMTGISQKELYRLSEVGHVKLKHGRVAEAQKIFSCLVKIDHKNPFYHSCLGSVHQKKGQFVDAVYEYSEAIKLKKDDLTSLVNRGEIYLKHKNYKKAAEDFRAAILLDSQGRDMFANRARSLVIAIKRNLQLQKKSAQSPQIAAAKSQNMRLPPGSRRMRPGLPKKTS